MRAWIVALGITAVLLAAFVLVAVTRQKAHALDQVNGPTTQPAYALDQNDCLHCHGALELTTRASSGAEVSLYVNKEGLDASAHRYVDCVSCHTTKPHDVPTPLSKLSLAARCGTCHQYEYKLHLQSVHGQQLLQGNEDVATCVDCHSPQVNPHSIVRVLESNAPAYKQNISQTCGRCHNNEPLMARYGILEKVYESYMRSFHGKAMKLSPTANITQLNKATCTNCHGTHDIKDPTDPTSPVAGVENLARTCEQCHPGAGVQFASSFLGHKEATPENFPMVHYAERFFALLTASVVALGVSLVLVETGKWAFNRRPKEE
ncbi:MAG: hypothetical protein HYY01_05440 [Chloroflexi bacterium]|nr:hypothetical protein [Chloroflexota bacterium]